MVSFLKEALPGKTTAVNEVGSPSLRKKGAKRGATLGMVS
jgi:hypothetical protein